MQGIVPPVTPVPVQPAQTGVPGEPALAWNKTYGGSGQYMAYSVIKIGEGYVMAGDSDNDIQLVRTDPDGNEVWRKLYGGKGADSARSVIAVDDGYVVAGSSTSYESYGVYDVYLFKTDRDGNRIWYKTYSHMLKGHLTNAFGKAVIAVDDGFVIVGDTNADVNEGSDVYLIKTDFNGTMVWNRTFGGDAAEHANAIIPVRDGFVIAGDTFSYGNGGDTSDAYLLKTDRDGKEVWNKTFGGKNTDVAYSVAAVDDGYVIVGGTKSYSNTSKFDVYLVKTDLNGSLAWEKHYGVADDDQGRSIIPVIDGVDGYVIAGYTSSLGNFYKDIYVLKTDVDGNALWNRSYGGADLDEGNSIVRTGDGGYAIAGYSSKYGIYKADFCLLKIEPYVMVPTPLPTATAGPTTQVVTAAPPVKAGGLTGIEMVILAVATVVIIAIVGCALAAIYLLPKK